MKKILVLLFLSISFSGFSQKIKLKKGEVLVNKELWLKYENCGALSQFCSLLNLEGEELIFVKFFSVEGGTRRTKANSKGTIHYQEIVFLGLDKTIEVQETQKSILKLLYNGKVINEDGSLDKENVSRMVEKYGTPFSDRLDAKHTIIINNN